MQKNSLTYDLYSLKANKDWDVYDYLYLIYSHRILGSGTSNQYNHGYNNSILINYKNFNNYKEFNNFMIHNTDNFCSCCVNQPPRYKLKQLIIDHFKPWADFIIDNIKSDMSIIEIVDIMNLYNKNNNLHRFNFHYLLMAGDLANYVNLDTKINGLFKIDEYSNCYLGPSSSIAMKILKPNYKYADFLLLCNRYNMKPIDLEDLLCVWIKYIVNPIWEFYIKPEHDISDFENGWDIIPKHKSYYKFKHEFNKK
jgi:hypothetical protein